MAHPNIRPLPQLEVVVCDNANNDHRLTWMRVKSAPNSDMFSVNIALNIAGRVPSYDGIDIPCNLSFVNATPAESLRDYVSVFSSYKLVQCHTFNSLNNLHVQDLSGYAAPSVVPLLALGYCPEWAEALGMRVDYSHAPLLPDPLGDFVEAIRNPGNDQELIGMLRRAITYDGPALVSAAPFVIFDKPVDKPASEPKAPPKPILDPATIKSWGRWA